MLNDCFNCGCPNALGRVGHCCMCGSEHATDFTCEPALNYTAVDYQQAIHTNGLRYKGQPEDPRWRYNLEFWLCRMRDSTKEPYRLYSVHGEGTPVGSPQALFKPQGFNYILASTSAEQAGLDTYQRFEHQFPSKLRVEELTFTY